MNFCFRVVSVLAILLSSVVGGADDFSQTIDLDAFLFDPMGARLDGGATTIHDVTMAIHRQLSSDTDFEHVCIQLRTIFHDQCSCGEFSETTADISDQVECDYSDIHAVALFSEGNPFSQIQKMNTLKVCKNQYSSNMAQVCTTIHYTNNVGVHCEVTVGGSDRKCQECNLCTTNSGLMGLKIDCANLDSSVSTECTSASQILELSAAFQTGTIRVLRSATFFAVMTLGVLASV